MPNKVVGGVTEEQLLQHKISTEAGIVAAADPLPGPLAEAFLPNEIEVLGYKIRPLVAYDWAIMKKIGSPVYRQMLEVMQNGEKAKEIASEPEEMWDLIFLLTRPCIEADKYFKQGLEAYREQSKIHFGMKHTIDEIAKLGSACVDQIFGHMTTMVGFEAKAEDDGKGKVFTQADKTPATASAGG